MTVLSTVVSLAAASGSAAGRLLLLLAVVGVAVGVFLLVTLVFGSQSPERDLESRLSAYTGHQRETGFLSSLRLLRRFAVRAERLAERRGVLGQIETALEQANIHVRAGEAMAGALLVALLVGTFGLVVTGNPITAIVVGGVGLVFLAVVVAGVASRQRRRFESQLPDTLNLMATSLRAGYSMLQALEAVAQEAPEPTAREFRRVLSEIRLGRSATEALQDSALRMESVDFDWVVLAFTIQREVGGNLAEVLQTTAETMMHRGRMRGEMRALTAEGRISAIILGAMPFLLFFFLYLSNPDYLEPLVSTGRGIMALVGAGVLLIGGLWWIRNIVKIEV